MPEISQQPTVICRVATTSPEELPYGGYHVVSMLHAIRQGRYFNVEPCHIRWQEPDGSILGWVSDKATWQTEGEVPRLPAVPGIAPGPEYDELFNAVERIMVGSWKGWRIRWGRHPVPDAGSYCGFVTHSRPSHGNVPRIEISPDDVISVWYHRPEPDLDGDDTASAHCASTGIA